MAATTFMRSWQDFDLIQLVVLPLFLFSGTFYPITSYPPAAPAVRAGHAAVPGRRPDPVAGHRARSDPQILSHVVYLTVMGLIGLGSSRKRLDRLLLK